MLTTREGEAPAEPGPARVECGYALLGSLALRMKTLLVKNI